jgi:hypothetical protein
MALSSAPAAARPNTRSVLILPSPKAGCGHMSPAPQTGAELFAYQASHVQPLVDHRLENGRCGAHICTMAQSYRPRLPEAADLNFRNRLQAALVERVVCQLRSASRHKPRSVRLNARAAKPASLWRRWNAAQTVLTNGLSNALGAIKASRSKYLQIR